jgi:hypothetical protein
MRAMALGLALVGLPTVAGSFPLSHAADRPREAPAPAASLRTAVVTTERFAPATQPPSQHRDDESGAVIMELRMGPQGVVRKGPVHCHGHVYPATEGAGPKSPKP